jgi:Tannase and feruloyl esterase
MNGENSGRKIVSESMDLAAENFMITLGKTLARRLATGALLLASLHLASVPSYAQRSWAPMVERPAALIPGASPARPCESLRALALPHTVIDQAMIVPDTATVPSWCRVTAIVSYPETGERFTIWIGLPIQGWNGRFQGAGGGGFVVGVSPEGIEQGVATGFATGATDGGVPRSASEMANMMNGTTAGGSFGLNAQGRLNWTRLQDFAYRGIHQMTVTGKAITKAFYGQDPRRAYFNGSSTGGRQGLMEVQRFPADYDGVLSDSPAINWAKFTIAQMWGELVMKYANHFVPSCKFAAAKAAAVAACDPLDGVTDGVIDDPTQCTYDPKELIGKSAGQCTTFTKDDADIIRQIWEGPRRRNGAFLWYGLPRGADFTTLNETTDTPPSGKPMIITYDWWRYFLTQNPQFDWTTVNRDSYEAFFDQSVEEFNAVIGTDNPDLSGFRQRGGKVILVHGWADSGIYPQGTVDYYQRVQKQMGGPEPTSDFIRLFMAPGVEHSGGGNGPQPTGQLDALVKWVEQGTPPETLPAISRDSSGHVTRSRPLCPFPSKAVFDGQGSTDDARNFVCLTDVHSQ